MNYKKYQSLGKSPDGFFKEVWDSSKTKSDIIDSERGAEIMTPKTTREEYYLKENRRQKRQLENLERFLKDSTRIKNGMLSERERFVMHLTTTLTVAKMATNAPPDVHLMELMIEDLRRERCRSLSHEDVGDLLGGMDEEMFAGVDMINHILDRQGYNDSKPQNTGWEDMR